MGKKRVAYSCAGEGRGHVTTLIAISQFLVDSWDVVFFCPGTVKKIVEETFPNNKVIEVPGLFMNMRDEQVHLSRTIMYSTFKLFQSPILFHKVAKILKAEKIEAVISDFEPYTAYAANHLKIPLLSLNHVGILLRDTSKEFSATMARLATRLIMPIGTKCLLTSFYNGDVGPILRKVIRDMEPTRGDFFLCYVRPSIKEKVMEVAKDFPYFKFRFFPDANLDFFESLRTCKGVITLGGHQMISESLHLEKPLLVFPLENQYEQILNGKMLEKSGRGLVGNILDIRGSLVAFERWIGDFPHPLQGEGNNFCLKDDTPHVVSEVKAFLSEMLLSSIRGK